MNDIILSSLLNLFALVGARFGVDRGKALELIEAYLKHYYGIQRTGSYCNLYSDLRGYYDDFPELDKDVIISGICTNLKGHVSVESQYSMLLSLLEFCRIGSSDFLPYDEVFTKVRDQFAIPDERYESYVNYVEGREVGRIRILPLWGGTLKTMLDAQSGMLIFTYVGDTVVLMNDVPVFNGIFQVWQQSGVLKGTGPLARDSAPLYYSSILALYGVASPSSKVELCGRHIEFRFDDRSANGMHDFSFNLSSGQLVAIMGGSGVGKSTLLSLLNGTLSPDSGSITINGHDISTPEAKALIGYVPQDDLLIEDLTVYENLWYTARLCFAGMSEKELDSRVMAVLAQLGLDQARDLKVGSPLNKFISGGQRKRLNIALELIREPAVLFLDEPTSGLSSSDTEKVVNLLKEQTAKGRLVVVNIHQPSSAVYKLFDRLWLLDKGGYPVYDGNPIDAVSYFKKAANYADADVTSCPVCGNVNPEIMLNIIDETGLDSGGHRTDRRKVSPEEWHSLYLEGRDEMDSPEVSAVPPTDQKRPGRIRQALIFLQRNVRAKLSDIQYLAVTLLEAPLLALVSALLTRYAPGGAEYTIMDNKNLPSYLFMAVIVAIFLGMSGSAEEIIKDRALLKREKFLHLSYGSYIFSKMAYMSVVCLVQTFLFIIVGNSIMDIHGMFWLWWMLLFVSAFLSSLIGLLLSQCLDSVVSIYITIPLLLIPQILLCGLVVHFEDLNPGSRTGNVPVIGDVIPSRWSYEALAVATFTMNEYKSLTYDLDREKYSCQFYERKFIYELETRLEMIRDAELKGSDSDPVHMAILRRGLSRLNEACALPAYEGDWTYDSLDSYLDSAKKELSSRGNRITLEANSRLIPLAREIGNAGLSDLKKSNSNNQLENLMVGMDATHSYVVAGDCIVPRICQVYLKPVSTNGRAPFYSGVKVLGDREIPTYWFNLCVLLLICVILASCLVTDVPGKFVRKD